MAKRLIQIAKELNVGKSTIVEYLNGSGFDIDDKPNAKITDEMYGKLLNEFQESLAIKERADQLIIGTRPMTKREAPAAAPEKKVSPPPIIEEVKEPEPEKSAKEKEVKVEIPQVIKEEKVEEVKEEKAKEVKEKTIPAPKLKILGKIDLSSKGPKAKKTTTSKEVVQETKPESKKTAIPEILPEVKKVVPEVVNATPTTPTPPKIKEETKVPQKNVVAKEEKAIAKKEEATTAPKKPIVKEEVPEIINKEEKATTAKEKEATTVPKKPIVKEEVPEIINKEEEVKPVDTFHKRTVPQLKGLKILGKIDANKFKKPKKKKEVEKKVAPPKPGEKTAKGTKTKPNTETDPRKKRPRKRKKVAPSTDTARPRRGPGGPPGRRSPAPRKRDEVKEVSKKEIEEKIKATMARISGSGKKKRQKMRRDKRETNREKQAQIEQENVDTKLQLTEFVSVSELASLMSVQVTDVITTCMNLGVIVSINQRLDAEIIELVAEEFGHEVEFISAEEQVIDEEEVIDDEEDLLPRAPIVTVMGHVDHGKTSLLDYIRKAKVVEGEAGGITQHIGAYEVLVGDDNKKITFLDTPGHEAFTAMRARGAKVTDIAVIIIAADDSIMPQTKEAISHAQAAGVPIVFAINKIDKDGAQPERIKQELANFNFLVEEWGGKFQSQDISAKNGLNIDLLLEKILLEAEMLELKANPKRQAIGTVVEASLDKGRGYVTKMLVQTGTLKIGNPLVAGEYSGKVKAMYNERGKQVKTAGPSAPVLVLGLGGAPQAGEKFKVMDSEPDARLVASKRAQISREQANRASKRISLDEIGRRLALGTFKELNLIVKGDVDGSIEALSDSLIKQSIETVQVNVIHKAVGQIIESDVLLASASDAIIIGFQVRPSLGARKLAEREGVQIKTYSIIYEAIEEVRSAIEGMLEPTKEKTVVGQMEVREVYKISRIGTVAGCFVQEGKFTRNTHIEVIRDGIVAFPIKEGVKGEISTLKRFKDDVKEVKNGLECGITVKNFNDIKIGDIIEGYEIKEVKQTLG